MRIGINNVELYYQTLGDGHPLIMIHGHHQDGSVFDKLLSPLSLYYKLYVPDMRGHGLSTGKPSQHYQTEVEDIVTFIKKLNLNKPYILGYGAGGVDALWVASKYPELVEKVIVVGSYVNGNGVSAGHILANGFKSVLQRDQDSKVALKETKIPVNQLKKIKMPVLSIVGEKDWVKVEHVRWYSELIPNCRLIVMPRQTHESYVVHSLKLLDVIKDFFS